MSVSHYDKDGKKIGEFNDSLSAMVVVVMAFVALLYSSLTTFSWIETKMSNWETLDAPYNCIFAFYHYLLQVPVGFFMTKFALLFSGEFTKYTNLNVLINISIGTAILVVIVKIIRIVLKVTAFRFKKVLLLFLSPAVLGVLIFLISGAIEIYNWFTITA